MQAQAAALAAIQAQAAARAAALRQQRTTTTVLKGCVENESELDSDNDTDSDERKTAHVKLASSAWNGTITQLLAFFDLPLYHRNQFPGNMNASEFQKRRNTLVMCIRAMVTKICDTIYPLHSDALKLAVLSPELVSTSKPAFDATTFISDLFKLHNNSKTASIERRVLRAVLAHTHSRTEIRQASENVSMPWKKLDWLTFNRAKLDAQAIIRGEKLQACIQSRAFLNDDIIKHAVAFILDESNICILSWYNSLRKKTHTG